MTKTKSNKVVPAELDGIPVEVATSMLTEPKVKMSNRMRKNCMAARQKVYPSIAPIRRVLTPELEIEMQYQNDAHVASEVKLARRAKGLKFCQLVSHHARMVKRRAKAQATFLKLMQSKASEQHKESLGRILTRQAELLEQAGDALAAEIKLRRSACAVTVK